MSYTENEHIITRNVEDEVKGSYLRYSMSVIIARALPDVRDGLKPSQRRILFAMRQLNLSPNAKFRKCAKISGDTSGDYHPHGEQVIYPTLVRMAQDWMMRYTLIQGQGNFGSVDGDPPAAMRYTEAKLTHAAVQLMDDLEKDTVVMVPNYDETKLEPSVFPSKFPNLVCNGSSGIAVGMATNIPPHNLKEVCKAVQLILSNPQVTIDEIAAVMPGPDFPTGGVICGQRGIREAYHTGRGKIILRGVLNVEKIDDSERERIIVEEIPYNVNKSRLIEAIAEMINSKQTTSISDIRDESDKDGLRIAIDLKKGEIPEVVINQLFKYSDLQVTFGCNMLALDKGLPRTMSIKHMLSAWIDHRIDVIQKRTRFELEKAEARAHILEGYLKAIDDLDEVVKAIRASSSRDEARTTLMAAWEFSDRQANAVLDLKLYQLTGLEHDKISQEYHDLLKKIDHLRSVLASEEMVKNIIREEMEEIIKQSPSDRKTKIVSYESDVVMEDLIADSEVLITISEDDYIKRMPIDTFKEQRRGGQGVTGVKLKREDDAIKTLYTASMHDYLLIFTTHGRCLWLKVWQIPEGSRTTKGKPLINLVEGIQENERIATILKTRNFKEEADIIMATEKGVVKRSDLSNFSNPRKKGIIALAIDEGDALIGARLIGHGEKAMLFTYHGMAVRFDESKVRAMGRQARGVRGAKLKADSDKVIALEVVKGNETILVVCENGFGKRSSIEDFRETNRGSSGVRSIITSDRNGNVIGALRVEDTDSIVLMSAAGQTVRINMKDVRVMGRNTQGVKLVNVKEGDTLVSVQKLAQSIEEAPLPAVENGVLPENSVL